MVLEQVYVNITKTDIIIYKFILIYVQGMLFSKNFAGILKIVVLWKRENTLHDLYLKLIMTEKTAICTATIKIP